MKKIVYTQRVEVIDSYGERRDCADQNIGRFIRACGFLPIPIMNIPSLAYDFCQEISIDGIFFTGGNHLFSYGGNAPERDETEKMLITYSEKKGIPLFGICRGMQMIADYYGAKLEKVENHVKISHAINGIIERDAVNSFHDMGVKSVESPLKVLSRSEDGVIEAVKHEKYMIAGIMWHSERVDGFAQEDIKLVSDFYNGGHFE